MQRRPNSLAVHTCQHTSKIVAEFRDSHNVADKRVPGSGVTVWEHSCKECGTRLYSVSQWQYAPDRGGVIEDQMSRFKVRTPTRIEPAEAEPKRPQKIHGKQVKSDRR